MVTALRRRRRRAAYSSHDPGDSAGRRVFDFFSREAISLCVMLTSSRRFTMSKVMTSPVFTAAIGPPSDGLRGDMSGHQSVRRAGEPSVGEQRDGIAQPLHRRSQPSRRAFPACLVHRMVPSYRMTTTSPAFDLPGLHGFEGILFALKHLGRSAEMHGME